MGLKNSAESDREIVEQCIAGDTAAFRRIYDEHKTGLYNVAFRLHRNAQDAEDSLQEAFVRVFRALPRFRGESRLSTWIYRITVNTCLNRLNRKGEGKMDSFEEERAPGNRDHTAASVILEQEIALLPLGYRTVFILSEVEGFSHAEIARICDITPGTSKSQLHKAKRILRKRLRPFLGILEVGT